MIQNLNKENFFNALERQYPDAVEHFLNWIDEYKREVDWNLLFGEAVKFHDIPFEMQNGIIARYELELHNNKQGQGKEQYEAIAENFKGQIVDLFAEVQRNIILRRKKLN